MGLFRTIHNNKPLTAHNIDNSIATGSEPQSVFLLDRNRQRQNLLRQGYSIDNSKNYGLVKKSCRK